MLGDDPETLDSELYEQESRQINCLIGNAEINDDHKEDGSQRPEVNQDIESAKMDVGSEIANGSSMDGLKNKVNKSNAIKQIIRERNPESEFGMNSKKADQNFRDNYDDINNEHDKCFEALGGEMLGNE